MAQLFVQKAPNTTLPSEAVGSAINVSFGSLPAIGNLVVVVTSLSEATLGTFATPTDNQGGQVYHLAVSKNSTVPDSQVNIWYAVVTASSGTFTVSTSCPGGSYPNYYDVGLLEYSGSSTDAATVCEATNSSNGDITTDGNLILSGSVTPSGNAVYVGVGGAYATQVSIASDKTDRFVEVSHSNAVIGVADAIGSGAKQISWAATSGTYCGAIAAFKEAVAVTINPLNSRSTIVLGQPRRLGGLLQTPASRVRTGRR